MDLIPNEIWLQILENLPSKCLIQSSLWSKRFRDLSSFVPVCFQVVLIFGRFKDGLDCKIHYGEKGIPELDWVDSHQFFVVLRWNPTTVLMVDDVCQIALIFLQEQGIPGKYCVVPFHVVDLMRSESSYQTAVTDSELDTFDTMNTISNKFPFATVNHPHRLSMSFIPEHATNVTLTNIHTMVPIGDLHNVVSFTMKSDGRFLDREGTIRYTIFKPIQYHSTLKHLILDGPWLETMVDYTRGVIESLVTLKQLETLIVDLDQQLHDHRILFQLLKGLPKLRHFGRLGRVDRVFWKQFDDHKFGNIETIELVDNPRFLSDLAVGCIWAFPNIKLVSIYVGFQGNLDTDDLLNIIKRFKEGTSVYKRPPLLKRINLFQVADVDLLQPSRWNYAASKHGGGKPLFVYVTDDLVIDGPLQKHSRCFGEL